MEEEEAIMDDPDPIGQHSSGTADCSPATPAIPKNTKTVAAKWNPAMLRQNRSEELKFGSNKELSKNKTTSADGM